MLRLLRQRRIALTSMPTQCHSSRSSKIHLSANHSSSRTHGSHSHSHSGSSSHGHSHHQPLETNLSAHHLQQCRLATIAGGCTNVFFSTTKIWLGSAGGSVALVADGFHAFTDIIADVISFVCITFARKSFPRCRYPFGIGRMETAGAVIVAAILLFGGLALLLQSSQQCYSDAQKLLHAEHTTSNSDANRLQYHAHSQLNHDDHNAMHEHHELEEVHVNSPSLHEEKEEGNELATHQNEEEHYHGHDHSHGHGHGSHGHSHFTLTSMDTQSGKEVIMWSMVLLAGSSVICKELLFQWTRKVGLAAGSRVVVANAYHHRADAWSGAVALLGVGAQCAGIPAIDGLAGLIVSLSIIKIGYSLLKESVMEFFDYQGAEVAEVRALLQRFYYPMHYHVPDKPNLQDNVHSQSIPFCIHSASLPHNNNSNNNNNNNNNNDDDYHMNSISGKRESTLKDGVLPTERYNMQRRSSPSATDLNIEQQQQNDNAHSEDNMEHTIYCTKDNNNNHVIETKPIRFINAFLTRHGHAYCLLVTLLVPTSTPANEIQRAINELTTLTRQKVEVHETFFKVLVCSETEVLSRSDYVQLIHAGCHHSRDNTIESSDNNTNKDKKSDVEDDEKSENMKTNNLKIEEANKVNDNRHINEINLTLEHSHPHEPIAAIGDQVNPSLEQCICTLNITHHFAHPIRYSWEDKKIYIHDSVSTDCYVDVLSVA